MPALLRCYIHNDNEIHREYQYDEKDFDYRMICFGWHRDHSGMIHGPGSRNYAQVFVVVSGKGRLVIDKVEYRLSEGYCFLIRPDTMAFYEADEQDPWEYYYIGFSGTETDRILANMGFSRVQCSYRLVDPDAVLSVFRQLRETASRNCTGYFYQGALNYIIDSFAVQKTDSLTISSLSLPYTKVLRNENSAENILKMVNGSIEQNFDKPVTVDSIAGDLGVSARYLNELYKKTYGKTVHTRLMEVRLEYAKKLLTTTDLSIRAVAEAVSFSDALYFSRYFRKCAGMSPQEYRKNQGIGT